VPTTQLERATEAVRVGARLDDVRAVGDAIEQCLAQARGLGLSDLEYRQVVQLKLARAHPDNPQTNVA
jgi:hypothetical protein